MAVKGRRLTTLMIFWTSCLIVIVVIWMMILNWVMKVILAVTGSMDLRMKEYCVMVVYVMLIVVGGVVGDADVVGADVGGGCRWMLIVVLVVVLVQVS